MPSTSSARRRDTQGQPAGLESATYHSNALARGLALLESIADEPRPWTLGDLVDATRLPKSTLVRLLSVLEEMDYVARVDQRPSYRLGHKVQRLSSSYLAALDLSVVADPYLEPLAERTGQTANLGLLDGTQVVHVCVHEPNRPIRFQAAVGMRDHAFCTGLGKVLLAYTESAALADHLPSDAFPRFTDETITTRDELTRELRRTRRRGYGFDDNERSQGLRCVAVPVLVDDTCLAAVSISGASGEFGSDRRQLYVDRLTETAAELADDPDAVAALRVVNHTLRGVADG